CFQETWVSFWNRRSPGQQRSQQEPQAQEQLGDLDFLVQDDFAWEGDQLSSQLYRNKQLQDTLLQKEEELARLHEENNNLRKYLNSALVKCLEEKAKKLLTQNSKSGKRKPKEEHFTVAETSRPKSAKRNLFGDFVACERQPSPPVDSWVLQTLGLKDIDTIDDSLSANYSALSSESSRCSKTFSQLPAQATAFGYDNLPIAYSGDQRAPLNITPCQEEEDLALHPGLANPPGGLHSTPNTVPFGPFNSPFYSADVSPNKTEVVFSTSLSPHCNVKTHSFHQGQAFVRRDEEGGWKFTWVPKNS
uniref:Geminin coiled-coil domain containing n=1 Tax=Ornithorhynchus anatinus TaxID=9258 RepID=F7DXQ7_ORNAN